MLANLVDLRPEREQSQLGMLEVLHTERNAHDRQAENDAQDDFLSRQCHAAQQHPDDIDHKGRAALADADFPSERHRPPSPRT